MRGQFLTKALLKTNDGCKGGWLNVLSHRRRSDRCWRQCLRMGSHYDLWSWSIILMVRTLSLTLMIASEIQTSFNQVSSFKPTRFLAIWPVSVCDGSSNWIGYAWMRLRSTISQAPMQWLCKVPLLSDKVLDAKTQFRWGRPKGGSAEKTILCIYAILDYPPGHQKYPTLGRGNSKVPWDVEGKRWYNSGHVVSVAGREDSPNTIYVYTY